MQITITHIAGLGDGVAEIHGKQTFIPFTCAGDVVWVEKQANSWQMTRLLQVGADRQTPPCPHFSTCGGCQLLHITPTAYCTFKQGIAENVARRINAKTLLPMVEANKGTRRRVEWAVSVKKGLVMLGFHAAHSHDVVDLNTCLVLEPSLEALIIPLKTALNILKTPSAIASIALTCTQEGVDAQIHTKTSLKPLDRKILVGFAEKTRLARLVEMDAKGDRHILCQKTIPTLSFGDTNVALPPGVFLQATTLTEKAMTDFICYALQGFTHVVDLFCGVGTFSFPLIEKGHIVHGFEGESEAVSAAHNAAKNIQNGQFSMRDLYKNPLKAATLSCFDSAIINPPRNGALPQVQELAKSTIRRVVMVSCNPATFTRDAKSLQQAGFSLEIILPIDQFYGTYHLELVGIFDRTSS